MLFRQLFEHKCAGFTYLVADQREKIALLIDPILETVDRDLKLINELKLNLHYCLETHTHADHITGADKLRQSTQCKIIIPTESKAKNYDAKLAANESLNIGGITIKALATPGHTPCHLCYYIDNLQQKIVFTGDTLLIRGCGRTDLPGGNASQLYQAITEQLFVLHGTTLVYPGHEYKGHSCSTIGEEKALNPRLAGKSCEEFVQIMADLNLPLPQQFDQAIAANLRCGSL